MLAQQRWVTHSAVYRSLCRRCIGGSASVVPRKSPRRFAIRSFHSTAAAHSTDPSTAALGGPTTGSLFRPLDTFVRRHIGPDDTEAQRMLEHLDPPSNSLDDFVKSVIPDDILSSRTLTINRPRLRRHSDKGLETTGLTESELVFRLDQVAKRSSTKFKSFIGAGYAGTRVPEVIKRNVLEGPGWYTSYTPYQPEISQGRLESLLNFQTMVCDLTALPVANASLLDEATAAAEAMTLSMSALPMSRQKREGKVYCVSNTCHPQTINVLQSRAEGFGISLKLIDFQESTALGDIEQVGDDLIGVMIQFPDTRGRIHEYRDLSTLVHKMGCTLSVGTDLLALTLLKPPGDFGADIAFGNAQRFGVPLGFGGPHAAFFACSEKLKRKIPGRLVGVSKDRLGERAVRLALQTREQHIRREKATSNVCTAQALLANMSAFYAIYHGPQGLKAIAEHVVQATTVLKDALRTLGFEIETDSTSSSTFDTIIVKSTDQRQLSAKDMHRAARKANMLLRIMDEKCVGITLDETVTKEDIRNLYQAFASLGGSPTAEAATDLDLNASITEFPEPLARSSAYLTHPVFNSHHSETELLRYIHHLQSKDLSLTHSMIPLGSCTMKLNATTEMIPISWPEFANVHPYSPMQHQVAYTTMTIQLREDLAKITGLHAVSLQPNSGAQGEFTGLRVIRKYQQDKGEGYRNICFIPVSAHGTNPASAAMSGMQVVPLKCDQKTGNLDMDDLATKCEQHGEKLSAIMITYPSTFGVFEPRIKEVCERVHQAGGLVYMDGANMNAQIGLCSPGEIGADVCHLNLHKTFCIPHGGGGPGVGPIAVTEDLMPFLPGHPLKPVEGKAISPVSAAPFGSAGILPISWAYIKMMSGEGLTLASKIAILNANYILARLKPHYPILYTNERGRCAHEFILDLRPFKASAGVEAIDVAKRLQDYGFHAPTMSWPVANTLMIEPTESEGLEELDRFCDAMIGIRKEIGEVEDGSQPREGNVLRMAPHSIKDLMRDEWDRSYTREKAAYPLPWLREKKFWPTVTRLDDVYGDSNLFCTCPPMEDDTSYSGV